ncbi:MAG: UDP-N-acetylglucosamine 2-epimerase [bacterium]|nr:UDP-N-acetylglucosamine 2-epimerase [bacterium]
MKKHHLTVVTGSRAEFYLMLPVIKKLQQTSSVFLNVVVTGGHFDSTMQESLKDIQEVVPNNLHTIPLDSQNSYSKDICEQISLIISKFSEWLTDNPTEMILVLGDRHEILGICTSAIIHRVPIAHIHGGDISEGAIDELIRHSVTKMSTYHFPATKLSEQRILQMGEMISCVTYSGSLGVENAVNNCFEVLNQIDKPYALLTCHPETAIDSKNINQQQQCIYESLMNYSGKVLITRSNFDEGCNRIYKIQKKWVSENPKKFFLINNLGKAYHSTLKEADFCIGNSSSALIEAPALETPSIDIGIRQKGRERGYSVIHCNWSKDEIQNAIRQCLDTKWINRDDRFSSPYNCLSLKTSDIIVDKIVSHLKSPAKNKIFHLK